MSILELLTFLETNLPELNWSVAPNLELGILATNTFELAKNSEKLTTLSQKLQNNGLIGLKNPAEIATNLAPILETFCQEKDLRIKATGPYLNLDLSSKGWQKFLKTLEKIF